MYKLYIESNGKAHVLSFTEKEGETQVSSSIQTLAINTDSSNELLNLDIPSRLISSTGTKEDQDIIVSKVDINDYNIVIDLTNNKVANIKPSDQNNSYLKVDTSDKKKLVIFNIEKGAGKYSKVSITFNYNNFHSSFVVHCIPQSSLYDVALDFGSEASQMLIKCADDDSAAIPQRLFHNTLRHYWGASVKGKRVYDQQDEDDKLFRSVFFKKEKGKLLPDFEIDIPNKKDSYFSFISKRTDILGERIPNIKISYLTGKEAEGGEKLRLHTGVILRFLHEALMQIADLMEEHCKDHTSIAIRFTLLLPNVMPQNSVSSLLKRLQEYSNSDNFLSFHKDNLNIAYIDIQSCSESDASFLERMNKIRMKPGERCLTIDIGKGTTDFSVTQKKDAYNASSEFRSGFVGAGNALSYAIFDNCVQILGGAKKNDLIRKILNSETAMLYELDNLIENFKHQWKETETSSKIDPLVNVENISVEVLLDRIRSMQNIGDKTGAIKNMVETISHNIIERLPDLKINKIVISGRAFRFKLLKDILETELKKKFKNVECYYNSNSAKSGCLIGASNGIRLCLSSSIVGLPLIIDASTISDNPQAFIEKVGDLASENDPLPVLKNNKQGLSIDVISQALKDSYSKIKEWLGNDDSEYTSNNSKESIVDDVKLIMTKGKEYRQINSNSLISISGRYYVPSDRYIIKDKDKPFSIYFDGDIFYLRHKNGSHPLIASTVQGTQNLCFESQFPYSIKDGMELM